MSAMLRLCRPSKPMNANATMVSATITSMSVNPPAADLLREKRMLTAGPVRRNGAAGSSACTEIEVARRDIGASRESVGDVERIDLLPIVEVDHRRIDVAVGIKVR